MKKVVVFVLLVASLAVCQNSRLETISAIEGAKILHSGMRDPDSFKIDKVWVMHSEKHGDAICYTYYAKNGFGGTNHSAADYAPNKKGQYLLNLASDDYNAPTGNAHAIFPGGFEYFSRCGERSVKNDKFVADVTVEVKKAMSSETASAPK